VLFRSDVATATAYMVRDQFEPKNEARPLRVVLARDDTAGTNSLAETFSKTLVLGGRPALESKSYAEVKLAATDDESAARILSQTPGLVVLAGPTDKTTGALQRVEAEWKRGAPRPTWILTSDWLGAIGPW